MTALCTRLLGGLGLVALLSVSTSAWAGGFHFADSGVVANGRGGAFVAGARGQFAQYYNPAGLVRSTRAEVNLGASLVGQEVVFTQLQEDGSFAAPVRNQQPDLLIPELGVIVPLPANLVLAVGLTTPYAPGSVYDPNGPQRYAMIRSGLGQVYLGPSLAWRPLPWLAVGATAQVNLLWVEREFKVTTSGTDDPSTDITVDASVADWFTPSFNAGVLVEPVSWRAIGASLQPPAVYEARGAASLDFSEHAFYEFGLIEEPVYTEPDVLLQIAMPLILRGGVAVRPTERWEIELAGVWEGWSSVGDLAVQEIDLSIPTAFGEQEVPQELTLPSGFRDAWSLRLGVETELSPEWLVRAGGFYERPALPPAARSVSLLDTPKVQLGAGLTSRQLDGRLWIDAALAYVAMPDQILRDSTVTSVNAFVEENVFVVGNGDIRTWGMKAGMNFRWVFGTSGKQEMEAGWRGW